MAKKNASGNGTIRQRPDGRWEGRATVGIHPGTGKPIRRSVYADTKTECAKLLRQLVKAVDDGTYQTPNQMTVSQWLDEWIETFVKPSVKPLTLAAYRTSIRTHIVPEIGATRLQSIRGIQIQKLYNHMIEKGLSAKTVKNTSAILHKSFGVAIKQGYLSANPCDAAELPKATNKEITPLTDADIPLFLQAIDTHRFRNAFALCLFGGLREGECLGLSWDQVDFAHRQITVNQQLQKSKEANAQYYISATTKSSKSRTITLPAIAISYLHDEYRRQSENRLRAGAAWDNKWNLVFTDPLGKHLIPVTFYKDFKKIAAAIGRPDARPHDLRHTAATVAIASGADIKSVQSLLGHATASFTLNVYAHSTERMMQDTADRMQAYYDTLRKKA